MQKNNQGFRHHLLLLFHGSLEGYNMDQPIQPRKIPGNLSVPNNDEGTKMGGRETFEDGLFSFQQSFCQTFSF